MIKKLILLKNNFLQKYYFLVLFFPSIPLITDLIIKYNKNENIKNIKI